MPSIRTRLMIGAASALLAGGVAWIAFARIRSGRETLTLFDDSGAALELLVQRQASASRGLLDPAITTQSAGLVRETIDPETAARLFAIGREHFTYDPFTIYRYRGGQKIRVEFPEHERGYFVKNTSREGFGESFEELAAKRDRLIVVSGDSHTDGLCDTEETFSQRLEVALRGRHPELVIEVLNTGVSGYSFYNYLGALEKLLPEKPDAFVVAFYGGNDFLDVLKPWHYFQHTAPPPRRADYRQMLERAKQASGMAVANAFNQLLYFQYHPDQVELALTAAEQVCAEIQRLCKAHGIALSFVYIPPGFDVDGALKPAFARAKEALGLADSDLRQFHRLADSLIGVLNQSGASVIDLRERFPGDIDDYYWDDLHINVKGHQAVADLLLARIEEQCFRAR